MQYIYLIQDIFLGENRQFYRRCMYGDTFHKLSPPHKHLQLRRGLYLRNNLNSTPNWTQDIENEPFK